MLEELRKQLGAQLSLDADQPTALMHDGRQFLTLRVASQELLVSVDDVREIIMPPPIAYLPRSQLELEGVIALRGEILPVVNLRRMLGLPQGTLTPATRILIVRPKDDEFGIIVDEITEFIWLSEHELDDGAQGYLSDEFKVVSKVAKTAGAVRPVLDVGIVLTSVFTKGDGDEHKSA